ncbi:MAG: glycosyltransferase [Cetobacterium sp.]|uniref:glycosyltransferase n=1 Tax=Cetobacterium sp. TaxID=2071632 RepID=UPI003EE5850E
MISVIIPLYNVEKYIYDCLLSFENQSYKDFEIIIIDDGSTDKSLEVVKTYIHQSKLNIKIIEQENQGVSVARNTGITNSKGEYICFVDSDDMVSPKYLQELFEKITEEIDISICNIKNISEAQTYEKKIERERNSEIEIYSSEIALNKFLLRDLKPGVWAMIIKKNILEKNNIYFTKGARYSEDIEFIYKILASSNKISLTDSKLYYYRIRGNSAMAIVDNKRKDGFKLMKNLENYYSEKNHSFKDKFKEYGVARWVYATIWQIALASPSFYSFKEKSEFYLPNKNMRKLLKFPKKDVRLVALTYIISPYMYFIMINKILPIFMKRKIKI